MNQFIKNVLNSLGIEFYTFKGKNQLEYKNELSKLSDIYEAAFATIIDIGANEGQFALKARDAFKDALIVSFEPIKSCYDKLSKSFENDQNFKSFNCALGKSSRSTSMFLNDFSPSSSLLEINTAHTEYFPITKDSKAIEIYECQFEELDNMPAINKPYLTKIDVQGYELEVIKNNQLLISESDVLIVETSFEELYKGQPLFDDIYEELKKLGFLYFGNYDQLYKSGSYKPVQADAIFRKVKDS